jgi:two-component system, NtrC family, sensor kinase
MSGGGAEAKIAEEMIQAFVRLAKGDFSVRLERTFARDTNDTLAYFVNLIAEELGRYVSERERMRQSLEDDVANLSEVFLALASGHFEVRAARSGRGDHADVLAYLVNNTAEELGGAFGELERQRSVLAAILDAMLDGVLLLDAQSTILRSNAAIAQLLGTTSAQLGGRPLASILAPNEHAFAGELSTSVATASFRDRTTVFLTPKGDFVPLAVNGSPYRDATGAIQGVVLVARDDRQLKAAQARLQISDRLGAMGVVAAGVAHEVNNPLAFLNANLEFAIEELTEMKEDDELPERLHDVIEALASAHTGASRVRQIVQDLRTFSRSDATVKTRVDLNRIVDAAVVMTRNEVRHHARLVTDYGTVPAVDANETRLAQVFVNLLQNAAHAIGAGRVQQNQIRVVTGTTESGDAFAEVEDSGPGMTPEVQARVFEPFFTTKATGTGLGLAICRDIITSLGGKISVKTEPGKGAVFRVELARASVVEPAKEEQRPSMPPGAAGAKIKARRRVLVVDDEREVAESVRRVLGREHDVDVVTSGSEALARLSERAYDMMLCDVLMPEMTGIELYARLAASRPDMLARIVFMSGGAFSPGAREFLDRVPNRRIDKPFDAAELRTIVEGFAPDERGSRP